MAITATVCGSVFQNDPGVAFAYVDTTVAAPADSLVVMLAVWSNDILRTPTGVDESLPDSGMTWTQDHAANGAIGAQEGVAIFSAPAPSGMPACRVMMSFSGNQSWGVTMAVIALSGADTGGSRLDGTPASAITTGGSTSWTTPSVTLANADSGMLALAWGDGVGSAGSSTTTSPFTELTQDIATVDQWVTTTSFAAATSSGSKTCSGTFNQSPAFAKITALVAYKAGGEQVPPAIEVDYSVLPKYLLAGRSTV